MLLPPNLDLTIIMLTAESEIRVSASSMILLTDSDLVQNRCLPLRDGVNWLTQSQPQEL
jgi:hypothetical protein